MNQQVKSQNTKKNKVWVVLFILLLLAQIATLFYYGSRKSGFHEDEFYSYYSTNRTAGLFQPDREWVSLENYRNEFVVLPGEGFRYGLVKEVQTWDVHPPLFYWILHTACSLFPGIFSKWLGIVPNILAFAVNFLLLWLITKKMSGKEQIAFAVCLFWGFGAAVISGVMFIRMYEWLTLFVLLCTFLHIRVIMADAICTKKQLIGGFYLPLMGTVYLGFLTQYYYIVFHIFLGAGFCLWLLVHKKWKQILSYAGTCAVALGLAIATYPACLIHIFRGYRGTEAVAEFGNAGNTLDRVQFFIGLINDYVFDGKGMWWLLLLCLLVVTAFYKKRGRQQEDKPQRNSLYLLLFACLGYFFTVAKSALLLRETSNRYELPIYGLILVLFFTILMLLGNQLLTQSLQKLKNYQNIKWVAYACLLLCLFGMDVHAMQSGRVFFLYEEEQANLDYARSHADWPVVIFYNDATPYNVWRLADELMEYSEVYMVDLIDTTPITDEKITKSNGLVVYAADDENRDLSLNTLLKMNPGFTEYVEIAQKDLWTVYEFH